MSVANPVLVTTIPAGLPPRMRRKALTANPRQLPQARTYEGMRRIEAATLMSMDLPKTSILLGGGSRHSTKVR